MSRTGTLLVISHTPHHLRDGVVVGWGATVRELDQLATRFERVRHVACLHPGPAPESGLAYKATNLELVPVPPAGAEGLAGKLDVIRTSPTFVRTILSELRRADMVHVRAPAHIALIAMLLLRTRKRPMARWFKYAGNWKPSGKESPSYTFQRWWLARGGHGGVVTVNGIWPQQPAWVRTFYNPSLDDPELERGRRIAAAKRLGSRIQLLFVGQLSTSKGAGRAIEILALVRSKGIDAYLELVGDGHERVQFEALASKLNMAPFVHFLGWQAPAAVHDAYARAHALLLPSASEGWPKVLSEGMAYGVVPLAGAVSSIPHYLAEFRTGRAIAPLDVEAFASAVEHFVKSPSEWAAESARAVEATKCFSFTHYLESVDRLIAELRV